MDMATTLALFASQACAPAPTTCPSCVFGATAATLHSYSYTIVQTITATRVPYVKDYGNGNISTVSVSTIWPTGVLGLPANTNLFTDIADMTWTGQGIAMAYPTVYIEYLGFERNDFLVNDAYDATLGVCSGELRPTQVRLPATTTPVPFIFPLYNAPCTTTVSDVEHFSVPLPTPLVSYLELVADDPGCEGLSNIVQCQALDRWYTNGYITPPATATTSCVTDYIPSTTTFPSTITGVSTCPDSTLETTTLVVAGVATSTATVTNCQPAKRQAVLDVRDATNATWLNYANATPITVPDDFNRTLTKRHLNGFAVAPRATTTVGL